LKNYLPEFENRPRILVFTKNDLSDKVPNLKINGTDVVSISALTGKGLDKFIKKIVDLLNKATI
jgi:tRNA U34 5-carboxymethylaminomethyl modifying GTPase MnmE/TrmE